MSSCCTAHSNVTDFYFLLSIVAKSNKLELKWKIIIKYKLNKWYNERERVCLSVINITQKQIIIETPNLVLYMCIISRCYLKLFMKIRPIVCFQGHTKESQYVMVYGRNFLLVQFNKIKLHKIYIKETHTHIFGIFKNRYQTE